MMTSNEWRASKYARANDGRCVESIILSNDFWDRYSEVVKTVEPLYIVLRIVDTEKFPQMSYVYLKMSVCKKEIIAVIRQKKAAPYLRIIEDRWETQMGKELHLADKIYLNLNSYLSFIN